MEGQMCMCVRHAGRCGSLAQIQHCRRRTRALLVSGRESEDERNMERRLRALRALSLSLPLLLSLPLSLGGVLYVVICYADMSLYYAVVCVLYHIISLYHYYAVVYVGRGC